MAGFQSFRFLLTKYLHIIDPKNILEWGPGESTRIMLDACPEAVIFSMEHDKKYHRIYSLKFSRKQNVFIRFADGDDYRNLPENLQNKKFDLIFVDGNCDDRVACLRTAHKVLADDGVVLLHDSERSKYAEGVKLFKKIEENDGTLAMTK